MLQSIANIFGMVIRTIYDLTNNNYALSIILFTILTKVLLFPLSLKQMRSTAGMQKVKPQYDAIMKKYKNDKTKQSEEIMKLYSEHKINPMGGCLPALIQIPLILAMFYIVRQPLTYIVQYPQEEISIYTQNLLQKEEVTKAEMDASEIEIANKESIVDMNFLGLNLGDIPSNTFSKDPEKKVSPITLLIPILSLLLSFYQTKQMQKASTMTDEQKEQQKMMNLMMPLLSGFIAYTMPLALGVYWLLGSAIAIIQQIGINKIINGDIDNKVTKLLLNEDKGGKENEEND